MSRSLSLTTVAFVAMLCSLRGQEEIQIDGTVYVENLGDPSPLTLPLPIRLPVTIKFTPIGGGVEKTLDVEVRASILGPVIGDVSGGASFSTTLEPGTYRVSVSTSPNNDFFGFAKDLTVAASDPGPISIALKMTGNESRYSPGVVGGGSENGASSTKEVAGSGSGSHGTLFLVNPHFQPIDAKISEFRSGQLVSEENVSLEQFGSTSRTFTGGDQLEFFYAEIKTGLGQPPLASQMTIALEVGGVQQPETGIPGRPTCSNIGGNGLISPASKTGLSIFNPHETETTCFVSLTTGEAGQDAGIGFLTPGPNSGVQKFLDAIVPNLGTPTTQPSGNNEPLFVNDQGKVTRRDHGKVTHPLNSLFSFKGLLPKYLEVLKEKMAGSLLRYQTVSKWVTFALAKSPV